MDGVIHLEPKIQKVLGPIILIHAYVFKLKLSLDAVIGQNRRELDELVHEALDELIVDIGDPRF